MFYYKDNEYFKPAEYLTEDTVNWGNHSDRCENCGHMRKKIDGRKEKVCSKCGEKEFGSRSVMLAAVKIIYRLGFKRLFIIGADFKMDEEKKYAFDQDRNSGSIKNNNGTYKRLNTRFDQMQPIFLENGFFVFNATPDSGLKSFPMIGFYDAIEMALGDFPQVEKEQTFGMYDKKAVREEIEKWEKKKIEAQKELNRLNGDNPEQKKKWQKEITKADGRLKAAYDRKHSIENWKAECQTA